MENRSRLDLMSQILEAAKGGATRSQITRHSFLSNNYVSYYLSELTERGLVSHDSKTRSYKTTLKGKEFLRLYDKLGEFMTPINGIFTEPL
jgi:predicted transcriptional regulator